MIETLFARRGIIARLQKEPLGLHLEHLATALNQQGYSDHVIRGYLRSAEKFGTWLTKQNVALADADESIVSAYIASLRCAPTINQPRGKFPKEAAGLPHLWKVLRQNNVLPAGRSRVAAPITPCEHWLVRFDQHLEQVVGAAPSTRDLYRRVVRRFVQECFGDGALQWVLIEAQYISRFITKEAATRKAFGRKVPGVAVRAALRFLVASGDIRDGLQAAVPTMRQWKHAALPRKLTTKEVERALAREQGSDPKSLRNYAILLLLAKLGLRAKEVVKLELDSIDWKEGKLRIHANKNHCERALPLSQQVGDALAAYLTKGRPKSSSRRVFLTCHAPFKPLVGASAVTMVAKRTLLRSGIPNGPLIGAHTFRHSGASEMVCNGASFKDVADILGHESLQTKAIYAKLDLRALAEVALPWAGGAQ